MSKRRVRRQFSADFIRQTVQQTKENALRGHIYILINPSMPNLTKIGMTTRAVETRLSELNNATGVAAPFIIVFTEEVSNAAKAEKLTHIKLQKLGVRLSSNREFFTVPVNVAIKTINEVLKENPELSIFGGLVYSVDETDDKLISGSEFLLNEIEGDLIEANGSFYGSRDTYRDTLYDIAVYPPANNSFLPNQTFQDFLKELRRAEQKLDLLIEKEGARSAYILIPIKAYKKEHDKLLTFFNLIETQTALEEKSSEHILIQVIGEQLLLPDTMVGKLKLSEWIEKHPLPVCEWLIKRLTNRVQDFAQAEHELLENIFDSLISDDHFSIDFYLLLDDLIQYTDLTMSYRALNSINNIKYEGQTLTAIASSLQESSVCAGLIENLLNLRLALLEHENTTHLCSIRKTDGTLRTAENDILEYRENEKLLEIMEESIKASVDDFLITYKELWLLNGMSAFAAKAVVS